MGDAQLTVGPFKLLALSRLYPFLTSETPLTPARMHDGRTGLVNAPRVQTDSLQHPVWSSRTRAESREDVLVFGDD
jgi:hypothetical protein